MSPVMLVGVVGGVGTLFSLGAAALLGYMLLNATEEKGDLKGQVSAKQAIIDQTTRDRDLSGQLVSLQTTTDRTLTAIGQIGRETIINVPLQNAACNNEPVLAVAADSVQRTRAAYRDSREAAGRGPTSIVRVSPR